MKQTLKFVAVLVLLLSCALAAEDQPKKFAFTTPTSSGPATWEYFSGQILLRSAKEGMEPVRKVLSREGGFYILRPLLDDTSRSRWSRTVTTPGVFDGYYILYYSGSDAELIALAETLRKVAWVSLSPVFKTFDGPQTPPTNDPLVVTGQAWQFWPHTIYPGAIDWEVVRNSKSSSRKKPYVIVGDTGFDSKHPDFNPSDLVRSRNSIEQWNTTLDDNGHGTAVTSVFAATANNKTGIAGIADGFANLIQVKMLDKDGQANIKQILDGILDITQITTEIKINDPTPVVVNFSWGAYGEVPPISEALSYLKKAGAIVIVAAGNNGWNIDRPGFRTTPASDDVIAVGACNWNGEIAGNQFWTSNWGSETVLVCAPGQNVVVAVPIGPTSSTNLFDPSGYRTVSGTSFAAPHVTGLVLRMLDEDPTLTEEQIKFRLLSGVNRQNTSFPIEDLARVYQMDKGEIFRARGSMSMKAISRDKIPPAKPLVEILDAGHSSARLRIVGINEKIIGLQYTVAHKNGYWQNTILPIVNQGEDGVIEFTLLCRDGSALNEDDFYYIVVRVADSAGNWSEWSEWSELIHTRKSVVTPITDLSVRDGSLANQILKYYPVNAKTWHQTTLPFFNGVVWHAGEGLDYRVLNGSDLELVSDVKRLPNQGGSISISFLHCLQMLGMGSGNRHYDAAELIINVLDDSNKVIKSKILKEMMPNSENWNLTNLSADITEFAGMNVEFVWRFYFISGSGGAGWYIAAPEIRTTAKFD